MISDEDCLVWSMHTWEVSGDFANPIINYLRFGYMPGSFFTALLTNDAMSMISHSHPSNTITALKALVGWIRENMPPASYGTSEQVTFWNQLTNDQRRHHLVDRGLVKSAWEMLKTT